jgi:hypothetical protein
MRAMRGIISRREVFGGGRRDVVSISLLRLALQPRRLARYWFGLILGIARRVWVHPPGERRTIWRVQPRYGE